MSIKRLLLHNDGESAQEAPALRSGAMSLDRLLRSHLGCSRCCASQRVGRAAEPQSR
jgi:hypothetical protein